MRTKKERKKRKSEDKKGRERKERARKWGRGVDRGVTGGIKEKGNSEFN